jgi:ABC-type antimicrobial peptide transport system permease subunit
LSVLAFVNFAALTFLRLLTRRRELAIRLSLGATRSDISLPLLIELLVVCGIATLVGIGGAQLLNTALLRRIDNARASRFTRRSSASCFASWPWRPP